MATTDIQEVNEDEIDMRSAIEEDISDESSDVEKYMELADYAEKHYSELGYAPILRDIASEELTHHKHLKAILDDMSCHGM